MANGIQLREIFATLHRQPINIFFNHFNAQSMAYNVPLAAAVFLCVRWTLHCAHVIKFSLIELSIFMYTQLVPGIQRTHGERPLLYLCKFH